MRGSQTGSQRREAPTDMGRRPAIVSAARRLFRRRWATSRDGKFAPYKREATGSNPVAPTRSEQKRRCLTCGNVVRHRLLLSGWLRLATAVSGWLCPIRAQVSQRRHRRWCPYRVRRHDAWRSVLMSPETGLLSSELDRHRRDSRTGRSVRPAADPSRAGRERVVRAGLDLWPRGGRWCSAR